MYQSNMWLLLCNLWTPLFPLTRDFDFAADECQWFFEVCACVVQLRRAYIHWFFGQCQAGTVLDFIASRQGYVLSIDLQSRDIFPRSFEARAATRRGLRHSLWHDRNTPASPEALWKLWILRKKPWNRKRLYISSCYQVFLLLYKTYVHCCFESIAESLGASVKSRARFVWAGLSALSRDHSCLTERQQEPLSSETLRA